ncbi:unnamed protein product, partial [Prorocentrum cordatum]
AVDVWGRLAKRGVPGSGERETEERSTRRKKDAAVRGRLDEAIGAADRALQTAAQLKQLPRRQVSAGAENIKPRLRSSSARPVAPTTTPRATAVRRSQDEDR